MNNKFIVEIRDENGEIVQTIAPSRNALSSLLLALPKDNIVVKIRVLNRFNGFSDLMEDLRKKNAPNLELGI